MKNTKEGSIINVLVAYMSQTGNTKKVAEAIFDEIQGEKEILNVKEVTSIEGYDFAFLGFPMHNLGPDTKTKKLLQKHCIDNRQVALFVTHASPEGHEEPPPMIEKFRQVAAGANIVGMFDCQGELAKYVRFIMSAHPDKKFRTWAKEDDSEGQPDAARLEKARAFARETMAKLASGGRLRPVERDAPKGQESQWTEDTDRKEIKEQWLSISYSGSWMIPGHQLTLKNEAPCGELWRTPSGRT